MKRKLIIFMAALFFTMPSFSHARYQVEWTPAISVGELYDDNINLDSVNEQADWITTISPAISLNLISEGDNNILLRYSPTWVRYQKKTEDNTVRHSGALTINQNLTSRLSFDLTDTLTRSEEPIEETEGIYGVRESRNIYLRNSAGAGIQYIFGPENIIAVGYDYSLLRNDDITLMNQDAYYPSAGLTCWLSVNNGIEVTYRGTLIEYSWDGGEVARDSISGDTAGIRYILRSSARTTTFIGYTYNSRYTGDIKDYDIHDGNIGVEHLFSRNVSLSLSGGYFLLKDQVFGDDNGYSYDISLIRDFNRGNFSIGGSGGWREGYLDAEQRDFIKYYAMDSSFDFQVLERLNNYCGLSYRQEKDDTERVTKDYRANYGWRLSFLRWFSISLDYSYLKRDDEIDTEDYNDNRIMMTLTASRMFR